MIISSGLILLPTNIVLDAEREFFDDDLKRQVPAEAADTKTESISAPDLNEITRDLALQSQHQAPARHIARGAIRPLITMLTSQYVVVAALVAGVAVSVAHYASRAIHEKFAAIVSALERF